MSHHCLTTAIRYEYCHAAVELVGASRVGLHGTAIIIHENDELRVPRRHWAPGQ
jgi:hypothetical protein